MESSELVPTKALELDNLLVSPVPRSSFLCIPGGKVVVTIKFVTSKRASYKLSFATFNRNSCIQILKKGV